MIFRNRVNRMTALPDTAAGQSKAETQLRSLLEKAETGWRPYAILIAFCALIFLPGLVGLPPMDRDESRFAQATKQMLETGDYVVPYFQDEPRTKKPVFIYWVQAASVAVFSEAEANQIWPYRLPSVLGGMASVILTFLIGARLFDRRTGLLGGLLLGGAMLMVGQSHIAQTDAVLLATILAGMYGLTLAGLGPQKGEPSEMGFAPGLFFWGGLGLSILTKGPIGPAVVGFAAIAWGILRKDASWFRRLKPLWGIPLLILIVAPWPLALWHSGAFSFIANSAQEDLIPKLLGGQESHGAPPGTYLLELFFAFWPMSLIVIPGLVTAWHYRREPAVQFLLCWWLPAWVMFEAVPTKLPHYVLPTYPALALMGAFFAVNGLPPRLSRWVRALFGLHLVFWLVIGVALTGGALFALEQYGPGIDWRGIGLALIVIAGILPAAWFAFRRQLQPAVAILALMMVVFVPWLGTAVAPSLDKLWIAREVADTIPAHTERPPLASVTFNEPSLIFMNGTDTKLMSGKTAADYLADTPGAYALVTDRENDSFLDRAAARSLHLEQVRQWEGFDYTNGDPLTLTLYKSAD